MKGEDAVRKMAPIELFEAGLPQTFQFIRSAVAANCNKVKYHKMR